MNRYIFVSVSGIFILLIPAIIFSAPQYEWLFTVGSGPGSFSIRPFSVTQPAEMEIIVEWVSVAQELEVSLYPPGAEKPIRRAISPSPIRWKLQATDVFPWKGLWRIVMRNTGSSSSYSGRVTVFLDYTKGKKQELPHIPKEVAPLPKTLPRPRIPYTLTLDDTNEWVELELTLQHIPEQPNITLSIIRENVQVTFSRSFQHMKKNTILIPNIPAFLGKQCLEIPLPNQTPFRVCYDIRGTPGVRLKILPASPTTQTSKD